MPQCPLSCHLHKSFTQHPEKRFLHFSRQQTHLSLWEKTQAVLSQNICNSKMAQNLLRVSSDAVPRRAGCECPFQPRLCSGLCIPTERPEEPAQFMGCPWMSQHRALNTLLTHRTPPNCSRSPKFHPSSARHPPTPTRTPRVPRAAPGATAGTLPGKGEARRGTLMGDKVRRWQGCRVGPGGPWGASGSRDSRARLWVPPTALRLFWQPPVERETAR